MTDRLTESSSRLFRAPHIRARSEHPLVVGVAAVRLRSVTRTQVMVQMVPAAKCSRQPLVVTLVCLPKAASVQ